MRISEMEVTDYPYDLTLGNNDAYIKLINVTSVEKRDLFRLAKSGESVMIVPDLRYERQYKGEFSSTDIKVISSLPIDIKVTKIIYHNPATIVFWSDGTKTVVKCDKNDTYDPEKGFYIACAKKLFGNNYKAVGRINKALEMAVTKG